MKNYYTKRILLLISLVFVLLVTLRKILPILFEKNYEDNIFLYQGIIKLILLFITIYIIQKDKLINWDFIYKNTFLSLIASSLLIFFSLQHTFTKINELKISVSDFTHYCYIFQCLATGFFEEFFFRILIFSYVCNALQSNLKTNNYKPILITSFLFSIVHLTSLFNDDIDKVSVLNQMMFAFVIGVILQSIFFRWNTIFLNSIIHAVLNYNGMIKSKLFMIEDNSVDVSAFENFIQSFITFVILLLIIALPLTYVSVRNRKNYLIK